MTRLRLFAALAAVAVMAVLAVPAHADHGDAPPCADMTDGVNDFKGASYDADTDHVTLTLHLARTACPETSVTYRAWVAKTSSGPAEQMALTFNADRTELRFSKLNFADDLDTSAPPKDALNDTDRVWVWAETSRTSSRTVLDRWPTDEDRLCVQPDDPLSTGGTCPTPTRLQH